MVLKKYLEVLLLTVLIFIVFVSSNNPIYALGDYQYLWVSTKIPIVDNNNMNMNGNIQIGCEVYCFWDRVIDVDKTTSYAFLVNGDVDVLKFAQELNVYKINDHKIKMYGTITVKTIQQYSTQEANKLGLVSSGFTKHSSHEISNYYYKTIEINHEIPL